MRLERLPSSVQLRASSAASTLPLTVDKCERIVPDGKLEGSSRLVKQKRLHGARGVLCLTSVRGGGGVVLEHVREHREVLESENEHAPGRSALPASLEYHRVE